VQAIHGREALELARRERPDLVISDVMMPVMDGADLCRRLKAELDPPVPVILASSADSRATAGSGADAFVGKPFVLDQLEALVHRLLP
jgi:CheY-like chemotaxis protein